MLLHIIIGITLEIYKILHFIRSQIVQHEWGKVWIRVRNQDQMLSYQPSWRKQLIIKQTKLSELLCKCLFHPCWCVPKGILLYFMHLRKRFCMLGNVKHSSTITFRILSKRIIQNFIKPYRNHGRDECFNSCKIT